MESVRRRIFMASAGMVLLGSCVGDQVLATPNGTEIATWSHDPMPNKIDPEHVQVVDLQKGTRIEFKFAVGTIAVGELQDVRSPVRAAIKVIESGGAEISTHISLMHFDGDPRNERTLNMDVRMIRGGAGCTGKKYTTDTARVRLRPSGKVDVVAEPPVP